MDTQNSLAAIGGYWGLVGVDHRNLVQRRLRHLPGPQHECEAPVFDRLQEAIPVDVQHFVEVADAVNALLVPNHFHRCFA